MALPSLLPCIVRNRRWDSLKDCSLYHATRSMLKESIAGGLVFSTRGLSAGSFLLHLYGTEWFIPPKKLEHCYITFDFTQGSGAFLPLSGFQQTSTNCSRLAAIQDYINSSELGQNISKEHGKALSCKVTFVMRKFLMKSVSSKVEMQQL